MKAKVLIIDDEEAIRSSLKMILEYEGYECVLAANGEAGLKIARRERPELAFLEIKTPQRRGIGVPDPPEAADQPPPGEINPRHAHLAPAQEASKTAPLHSLQTAVE